MAGNIQTSMKPLTKGAVRKTLVLGYLSDRRNQTISMRDLFNLTGLTDKSMVTKLMNQLRRAGHRILSLAGKGGYMLVDPQANDIAELKNMVASIQSVPVPTVPVPRDITGNRTHGHSVCSADRPALVTEIMAAQDLGRPFTKSGRHGSNGIYARRSELPAPFNILSRDRLEQIVADMLSAGTVEKDHRGYIIVPAPEPGAVKCPASKTAGNTSKPD